MGWEFDDFPDIVSDLKSKKNNNTIKCILAIIIVVAIGIGFSHCIVWLELNTAIFSHNDNTIFLLDYDRFDDIVISQVSDKYNEEIVLLDSSDLTPGIIANRNGKLLIERCVCYVDKFEYGQGSGTILNCFNPLLNYVHYENMDEEIRKGTIVITYFVYNPDGKNIDDVIDVYDFVLTRQYEVKDTTDVYDIIYTGKRLKPIY